MKRLLVVIVLIVIVSGNTGFTASRQFSTVDQLPLQENTKYRIYRKIDLKGQTLQIPQGCTLAFRGGTISNGTIVFNTTVISGHPRFRDCQYKGDIIIKKLNDKDFTSSEDKSTFVFLFSNAVRNGIKCDFYRDYHISMDGVSYNGIMLFENLDSGADIRFHNSSLYNTYVFPTRTIRPVIVFRNVKNITIWNSAFYDVDGHNTHLNSESNGCTFIQCYGDCEGINLNNCYQENGDCILRSGVYQHNSTLPNNTPSRGLINSSIIVKSKNTGYGLALYCGDNLTISIVVDSPHRGFYCTGVSNSTIKYYGNGPTGTNCHILIKDAVYKKRDIYGNYSLDMKACSNLVINATIDELMPNENVIVFSTYGSGRKENADFRFRSEPCHHHNIDITAEINHYPDEGSYSIVSFYSDSGALNSDDVFGCKVTDVIIHDINRIGGNSNRYLCVFQPNIDAQVKFVNCSSSIPQLGYNLKISGNTSGRITLINCSVDNIFIHDKDSGGFVFDIKDTRINGGLVYVKGHSVNHLVQINQLDE